MSRTPACSWHRRWPTTSLGWCCRSTAAGRWAEQQQHGRPSNLAEHILLCDPRRGRAAAGPSPDPCAANLKHFAADAGLDCNDPLTGMAAVENGSELRVDIGSVNDRQFINNASIGFYSSMAQDPQYRSR